MKRALAFSLILHIVVFVVAFFLIPKDEQKVSKPFYARIITPEELPKEPGEPKAFQSPRFKETLPPPKDLSSVPTRRGPKKESASRPQQRAGDRVQRPSGTPPQEQAPSMRGGGQPLLPAQGLEKGQESATAPKNGRPPTEGPKQPFSPPVPMREKLFDKGVIGDLVQKDTEKTKPDSSITFDTKEFRYYGYMERLKEKLERIWKYPRAAAERGIYGDLYIRFTIKKNGSLGNVELVRTSGHKLLDDAAIKALRDAEPYWPLPDEWKEDEFSITGHFIYTLYGYYIR